MNGVLLPEKQLCLNFSSGWLIKFQKHWDLKVAKLHGESGDADDEAIAATLPYIHQKLKNYNINYIWSADETGLKYRLAPCTTIAHAQMSGRKQDKVRLSYSVCANADGTETVPFMIIGCMRKWIWDTWGVFLWNRGELQNFSILNEASTVLSCSRTRV